MRRGAAALLAAAACALLAPSAQAGWSAPVRVAGPTGFDVLAPRVALSPRGSTAIAFTEQDADDPANSIARVTLGSAGVVDRPRTIPGAQQILDLGFGDGGLALLTGGGPPSTACCHMARVTRLGAGAFAPGQTIVGGLSSIAVGRIVGLGDHGELAVLANAQGVWVARSPAGGRFGPKRRLTASSAGLLAVSATGLPRGGSAVAWSEGPSIVLARGGHALAPRGATTILTLPAGHRVDELGLAPGPRALSVAWVESWVDGLGAYHSQARTADLQAAGLARVISLSPGTGQASALALAGDGRGSELAAWKSCPSGGLACSAAASSRSPRHNFSAVQKLGAIDAGQEPQITLAAGGRALAGWVRRGRVLLSARDARGRLGAPRVISHGSLAGDLALAAGGSGDAVAAWTQGTLHTSVFAAFYRVGR